MNSSLARLLGASRLRTKRPLLAMITRSLRSRSVGLDGWRNEPQAVDPAAPAGLDPQHLAPQQEAQPVLEDGDDVGRQRPVRAPAEVGHVDGDAPARLQDPDALGEDVLQHLEVVEVGGGDVALAEVLLVGLAREVRRRGHHQGHRGVGHPGHVPGVAGDEDVALGLVVDGVVVRQDRWGEPGVEGRGVVVRPAGHAEGGRGRGLASVGHGSPPGPRRAPDARCYDPTGGRPGNSAHAGDYADGQ